MIKNVDLPVTQAEKRFHRLTETSSNLLPALRVTCSTFRVIRYRLSERIVRFLLRYQQFPHGSRELRRALRIAKRRTSRKHTVIQLLEFLTHNALTVSPFQFWIFPFAARKIFSACAERWVASFNDKGRGSFSHPRWTEERILVDRDQIFKVRQH